MAQSDSIRMAQSDAILMPILMYQILTKTIGTYIFDVYCGDWFCVEIALLTYLGFSAILVKCSILLN